MAIPSGYRKPPIGFPGKDPEHGIYGYRLDLAWGEGQEATMAEDEVYSVTAISLQGIPLSRKVFIPTGDDCNSNMTILHFVESKDNDHLILSTEN